MKTNNIRFHIGDKVCWDGGPNEFRDNRHGTIIDIRGNKVYIDKPFYPGVIREVPLKILKLEN